MYNLILTSVIVLGSTLALAFWCSPSGCRWLSWLLETRAASLDAYNSTWEKMRGKDERPVRRMETGVIG